MKFYSTKKEVDSVSFQEAIFKGLPDDNGLFMPEFIPELPALFWEKLPNLSLSEIGKTIMQLFIEDEIDDKSLTQIVDETLNFEIPLVQVSENMYSLELFHGPTYAFKDVGARFLARCLSHFTKNSSKKLTVLVATSGDTGSAVAQGFYDVPNIEVIILYPKGGISDFQKFQMTSLGKNIIPLEVDGVFDDCQHLVKQAFLDEKLSSSKNLTSANSINIARLLPQSIYYFYALGQLQKRNDKEVIVSVPSGNYGNLSAGLISQRMGNPISHFLACSNKNDTVPNYLETSVYSPKPSVKTISNAMDVGAPSNFARMKDLFDNSYQKMSEHITGYSFTDEETRACIKEVYNTHDYVLDPHGAVAYLGLQSYGLAENQIGIFLETAHPYKFKETVEPEINSKLEAVEEIDSQEDFSTPFNNNFDEFKQFLEYR